MILDTNALSEFAEGLPEAVAAVKTAQPVQLPIVVLGEYRYGIAQSRHRVQHETWLKQFVESCGLLHLDEGSAEAYAEIRLELKRAGTPIPVNDLWIAALCRQHRLPILSRDRHFDLVKGLRRSGW